MRKNYNKALGVDDDFDNGPLDALADFVFTPDTIAAAAPAHASSATASAITFGTLSIAIQDLSAAVRPSSNGIGGSAPVQPFQLIATNDLPIDPLFGAQWNLLNAGQGGAVSGVDIDIAPVWQAGFTGKGISIGVYDTAMDVTHTDLAANIDMSKKIVIGKSYTDPTKIAPYGDEHATAVAGIIGAARNDDQVVGIAYDAKITPVDIFDGDDPNYGWEALWNQNKFAVTNHSWGFTNAFVANQLDANDKHWYLSGFTTGANTGRGGLGTIENVAAGNYRQSNLSTETNGLTVDRHVVVVGATDDHGFVSYYSNPGASLLVVAPSSGDTTGVTTDDVTGAPGYSAGDYTNTFGGTSAATPQLSGIAADILQANPHLGWRDVQDILAITARHTGSAVDSGPQGYERDTWAFNNAGTWNGGGLHFSNDYGFGLVDANAAVALASSWNLAFGTAQTSSNELVARQVLHGHWDVGDGNVSTFQFSLNAHVSIESVVLDLNDLHFSAANHLVIDLISPNGTDSNLLDGYGFDSSSITEGWELMSRRFAGEDSHGTWTLRITDTDSDDIGSLGTVTLSAYGSSSADESIFFYTDEFAEYWDVSRATVSYTSWPVTIEAAAVTGEIDLDLRDGTGTIDGKSLAITDGTKVQLFIGGTGGNVIHAGSSAVTIYGGADSDQLFGGSAADKLFGLAGDDLIVSGSGNEALSGGAGNDTVSYENAGAGVTVSLAITSAQKTFGAGTDTLSGFENITGSAFNDTLTGNAGDNLISGGNGDDILIGGGGNDTLDGGDGSDTVSFAACKAAASVDLGAGSTGGLTLISIENVIGTKFSDVLTGDAHDNILTGGAGADTLDGGDGIDTTSYAGSSAVTVDLTLAGPQLGGGDAKGDVLSHIENVIGSSGNDSLTGDGGDNVLTGCAGNDTLTGGAGADTLDGGAGSDTASYATSADAVTVDLGAGTAHGGDAEGDTLTAIENLTGSAFDDTLAGDAGNNALSGGAGTDTVSYENAGAGVTVSLAVTSAQKTFGAGTDTLSGFENITGSAFNDTLTGNAGDNLISGGNGDDILIGGGGNDTLDGGDGSDTVSFAACKAAVSVDLNAGSTGGLTLISIENVVGTKFSDVLTGDSHDNILTGGAGADTLDGGDGIDTVSYAGSSAMTVDLTLAGPQLGGGDAKGDVLSHIENIIGSSGNDSLTGDGGDNVLTGCAGNDILTGGAGADTLDGGAGTDTASYSGSSDAVTVDLGAGTAHGGDAEGDTLTAIENLCGSAFDDILSGDSGNNKLAGDAGIDTVSYENASAGVTVSLAATSAQKTGGAGTDTLSGFENITGSAFNDTLTGNAGDNLISGGNGDDILIGGGGNDTLDGGDGSDTVSFAACKAAASVDLGAGSTGGLTLISIENVIGTKFSDVLTGDAHDNILTGGAGADTLDGGDGIDTTSYAGSSAVTVDLTLAGPQLGGGDAKGDVLSHIENVIGSSGNDSLTGDGGDNVLTGCAGNDTLTGGAGADTLDGGAGSDTASYATSADAVTVDLGAGTAHGGDAEGDTLTAIENLTGSAFDDTLAGDAGNNALSGGAGTDTVSYENAGAGVTVSLAITSAQKTFGAGTDTLSGFENITGSAFNDTLTGNAGDNLISGGNGDDILIGGGGNDTLMGGAGKDQFKFLKPTDGGDFITDFNSAGDQDIVAIQKSGFGIATSVKFGAGNAFDFEQHYFVSGDGATATEAGHGQFLFDTATGSLSWDADGTGGNAATLVATLTNHAILHASDFVLV